MKIFALYSYISTLFFPCQVNSTEISCIKIGNKIEEVNLVEQLKLHGNNAIEKETKQVLQKQYISKINLHMTNTNKPYWLSNKDYFDYV